MENTERAENLIRTAEMVEDDGYYYQVFSSEVERAMLLITKTAARLEHLRDAAHTVQHYFFSEVEYQTEDGQFSAAEVAMWLSDYGTEVLGEAQSRAMAHRVITGASNDELQQVELVGYPLSDVHKAVRVVVAETIGDEEPEDSLTLFTDAIYRIRRSERPALDRLAVQSAVSVEQSAEEPAAKAQKPAETAQKPQEQLVLGEAGISDEVSDDSLPPNIMNTTGAGFDGTSDAVGIMHQEFFNAVKLRVIEAGDAVSGKELGHWLYRSGTEILATAQQAAIQHIVITDVETDEQKQVDQVGHTFLDLTVAISVMVGELFLQDVADDDGLDDLLEEIITAIRADKAGEKPLDTDTQSSAIEGMTTEEADIFIAGLAEMDDDLDALNDVFGADDDMDPLDPYGLTISETFEEIREDIRYQVEPVSEWSAAHSAELPDDEQERLDLVREWLEEKSRIEALQIDTGDADAVAIETAEQEISASKESGQPFTADEVFDLIEQNIRDHEEKMNKAPEGSAAAQKIQEEISRWIAGEVDTVQEGSSVSENEEQGVVDSLWFHDAADSLLFSGKDTGEVQTIGHTVGIEQVQFIEPKKDTGQDNDSSVQNTDLEQDTNTGQEK